MINQKAKIESKNNKYSHLLNDDQDYIVYLKNLQELVTEKEDFEKVSYLLKEAIKLEPESYQLYQKLGEVLLKKGDIRQAISTYRKAIKINPKSAWCHHKLGDALTKKGWFIASRNFYLQAQEIDSEEVFNYQEIQYSQSLEKEFLSPLKTPIFIVGCPHSGTTLMTRLIGNHPFINHSEYQETHVFSFPENKITDTLNKWNRRTLEVNKKRWVNKSIIHTFKIAKILQYYPKSPIIIMLRDGRDVFCSIKKRKTWISNINQAVNYWIYANIATLNYWHQPNFKVVKYEDLVSNPVQKIQEVCEFIGEEYHENILNYHQKPLQWNNKKVEEIHKPENIDTLNEHKNLRSWQINQPLFDGRKRWEREMTTQDKKLFKSKAQQYLQKFGYVENSQW